MSGIGNDPIQDLIVSVNIDLLFDHPFFGNLATRLEPVDASKWCKTFGTCGRKFYYNREYVKSLSKGQLKWSIIHMIYHLAYGHLERRSGKNKKLWDMANDYIINYSIEQEVVKKNLAERPAGALYSEKYTDEFTSEELYRILEENSVEIKIPLDEHMDLLGEDDDGNGSGYTVTVVGDENGKPHLTDADMASIRTEIQSAIMNAIQSCEDAGQVPAGIRRLIKDLTSPVMDWRALLETHIQSQVKGDYSLTNPSKRSWALGVILPSQKYLNTIDVSVTIDTSGSMTDQMLKDFLSEVKGIMETFEDFKLRLWTFDGTVHNPKLFTPHNLDEIFSYDPMGGGGTLFMPNWDFMKDPAKFDFADREGFEEPFVPNKFVMFTDGYYGDSWGDPDYCDTLFVLHGTNSMVADFGLTAYYSPKS